jgi:predicted nucleic acid-binding Zn ribbon protein
LKEAPLSPINPEPTPISSSIDRLLKSLRGGDRQTTVTVFSRWAEIVGEPVCSHVKPLKLDAGTLIVEVDEPAWATQLKFLEADLLTRLNVGGAMPVERLEIRVQRRR